MATSSLDVPAVGAAASATVRTDLTATHFRGFVRKDEFWPEESEQYKAGCDIENRKRPPPAEVPGDVFDRQRVIPGFDQGLIERQVCLVLGTGGIGQDVALTLGRLGVGKIILVDRDVYDANNLTRQCLGGKADVGQRKVDVAARTLRESHGLRSEVLPVHCDAVEEWPRIVELAREATVVFNGIDVGVMWDFCVNSLCKELGVPLVAGQSFGWKFMTEMYSGKIGQACATCRESTAASFAANERDIVRAGGVRDRLRSFLVAQCSPGSSGYARLPEQDVGPDVLATFLVADRQFRISGGSLRDDVIRSSFGRAGFPALRMASLDTDLLAWLKAFQREATDRLLPGRISQLPDIAFVPRPAHADTRYIGSWICPCLGCAVMMVSQWAATLTAPLQDGPEACAADESKQPRNLPSTVTFNLDQGLTAEEQLVYEIGMPLDRADRAFLHDMSQPGCEVCRTAALLAAEESLFVGALPVTLAPAAGDVLPLPTAWSLPTAGQPREAAAARVLRRQQPLADLGEDYRNVVVPAMPALDWGREDLAAVAAGAFPSTLPPELATLPLLKVSRASAEAQEPSALSGLASGVRSALVRVRGRWWRLKGCGNRDQGFPVEAKGDQGELNLRGCCFEHTADTELRMTALAEKALAAVGLDCANRAVGSYRYAIAAAWPLPKLERFCPVFETLGNARLGDHLLAGLLALVPDVMSDPGDGFAALKAAVAAGRGAGADPNELWDTATVVSCGMPVADVLSALARGGTALAERPPPPAAALGGRVPLRLHAVFDAARAELEVRLGSLGGPSLLLWLAWRLGYECGLAVKALHAAGIAWGTYADAMGIHCNAHVNNLVVKPPSRGTFPNTFLAPLDFDMAFTKEGYLPEACSTRMGLDSWDGILEFEGTMGMLMVLGGSDFASTGVANTAATPSSHAIVETAVRDTLCSAYRAAREGSVDVHPHDAARQEASHALIRLALCLTTHVEG